MMKRYKLLKDLPGVKAGAIFHRYTNEIMQVDVLKRVDDQGILLQPSFSVSSIYNFDEWFEEIGQFTINDVDWNFDPKPGDICYCVDNAGNILSWTCGAEEEKAEVAMGNCFRIREEAEVYRQWLKAVAELRRSSDFKPDWNNTEEKKYYVYYDYIDEILLASYTTYGHHVLVYYRSRDEAEQSIKDHKEAWLTYFGAEKDD